MKSVFLNIYFLVYMTFGTQNEYNCETVSSILFWVYKKSWTVNVIKSGDLNLKLGMVYDI